MISRSGSRTVLPTGYEAPITRHGKGKEAAAADTAAIVAAPAESKRKRMTKAKATESKGKGKAATPDDESSEDPSDDSSSDSEEEEIDVKINTRFQINRVPGAPSAETELPWPRMTDMSIEELLIYYPNHVFTWPGLTLLIVQVYWRSAEGSRCFKDLANIINGGRGLIGPAEIKGNQIRSWLRLSMSKAMGIQYDYKIDAHDALLQQLIDRAEGVSNIEEFINQALVEKPQWLGTITWQPVVHIDEVAASVLEHPDGNFTDRLVAASTAPGTMVPAPILAPGQLHSLINALPAEAAYVRQQTLATDVYPAHIHPIDILKYYSTELRGEVLLYALREYEMGKVRDVWMRHLGLTTPKDIAGRFGALRKRREAALTARAKRLGTDFKIESMNFVLEVTGHGRHVLAPLPYATPEQITQWATLNPNKKQVQAFFKRQAAKAKKGAKTAEVADEETVADAEDEELPDAAVADAGTDTRASRLEKVIQHAAKDSAFWKAVIGPAGTTPENLHATEVVLQTAQYDFNHKIIPPPIPALDGSKKLVAPAGLASSAFAGAAANGGKGKRGPRKGKDKTTAEPPTETKAPKSKSKSKSKSRSKSKVKAESTTAAPAAFVPADEPRIWSTTDNAWRYADANGAFTSLVPLSAVTAPTDALAADSSSSVAEDLIDPKLLRGLGEVAAHVLTDSPSPTPSSAFVPATPVVRLVTTIDGRAAIVPTGQTAGEVDPAHDSTGRLYQLVTIDGAGVLVARYINEAPLHIPADELPVDFEALAFRLTAQEALAIDRVPALTAAGIAAFEAIPNEDILNIRFDRAAVRAGAIEAAAAEAYVNTDFEDANGESIVPARDDGSDGRPPTDGEAPSESGEESSSSSSSEELSSGSTHTNSDNDSDDNDDSEDEWRAGEYYQSLLTGLPTDSELPDQPVSPISDLSVDFDTPAPAAPVATEPIGAYVEDVHPALITAAHIVPEEPAPAAPTTDLFAAAPYPPIDAGIEWLTAESARLEAEARAAGVLTTPSPPPAPVLHPARLPTETANHAQDAIAKIKRKRALEAEPETETGPSTPVKRVKITPVTPVARVVMAPAPAPVVFVPAPASAAFVPAPIAAPVVAPAIIAPALVLPAIPAAERVFIFRSSPPTPTPAARASAARIPAALAPAAPAPAAPTADESTPTGTDVAEGSSSIIEDMVDMALSDLEASSEDDEEMVDV